MSFYSDYIKERENKQYVEFENGFIVYKIVDKECYLSDMYINKNTRGGDEVKNYISALVEIGKKNDCENITANIYLNDSGANRTLRAALKLDFKIIQANNNVIVIAKNIKE